MVSKWDRTTLNDMLGGKEEKELLCQHTQEQGSTLASGVGGVRHPPGRSQ